MVASPGTVFWTALRTHKPASDVTSAKIAIYQRLYYSARRDERAAMTFAFAAAAELAAKPIRSEQDIALIGAPRWVIEGIGAAWQRYLSDPNAADGRLDVALGRNPAKGARGLHERYKIDYRDMLIAIDAATLLASGERTTMSSAVQHLAGIYEAIEEDTIAKAWQRFGRDAELVVGEELRLQSPASRSE